METPETPEPEPGTPETPEPDSPEGEPDTDEEPAPEEADLPSLRSSETVLAEHMKAMNAAAKTHESRLRTILGDDFDAYMPCPLCLGDSFLVPTPPGVMDPEQWDAVKVAAGHIETEDYLTADYSETCVTCDGHGMVLSGSKAESQRLIVCRTCEGKGWKAKLEIAPPPPVYAYTPPAPPATSFVPAPGARLDEYGRPEGHPHFGMPPAMVFG